ncbi:MAG: glycosyltransferase, partial [Clostridia bacterium]|nr:glycosyltransferase [Clostridia bacterium]
MKILQVNCVYNTGSTGKIVYDVHTELVNAGHESVVCYGRGQKTADKNVYKNCSEWYSKLNNLISRFTGVMYGGCFFSTNKLIRIIKRENPDIVHLHCINGYFVNIYRLITWLKKNNVKTVLTLHAEFMHTANCGHAFECEKYKTGCGKCPHFKKETKSILFDNTALSFKKMKKAFDGFNNNLVVTSVSPWLMDRAQNSIILGDKKHTVVMNGLDTSVFYPHGADEIRKKHNLEDKKFVLFVTPVFSIDKNHIKGGWYLIELAKRMPEVVFGVIGAREQYDNLPKNVINIGRVDDQDTLAKYYSAANATILLSQRETFSMVTAESLCCGTSVIGFKAGGPETISIDKFCSFVPYGDIDDIQNKLEQKLNCEKDERISQKAASKYDKRTMANSYLNEYSELLNRKKKILQVNVVYKKGSTGKIINDIHTELLTQGYDSLICYGRGKKIKQRNVYKTCSEWYSKLNNLISRFTGVMYGGCFFSTNNLIRIIKRENPDIVHLHCINGYFVNIYRLITWLKENNVKTVLTLHAEFMHTANCGYALDCEKWRTGCGDCPRRKKETKSWFFDGTAKSFQRMKKAFEGFDDNLIVTSVSPWLMDRAQNSIILGDKKHTVVMNGLDT